jgi:hypothetical protein
MKRGGNLYGKQVCDLVEILSTLFVGKVNCAIGEVP